MKYKVSLTQRTRIYTEMDADSKENAYWKVMDLLKIPEHGESYDVSILGPSNVKIKEMK
jgi:hypothetical protein